MLRRDVYEPIGVLYMHANSTVDGVPLTAWGSYPTIDDMAKIADLVQRLGVTREGQQLLSREVLREALYETDTFCGLPTGRAGTNPGTKMMSKTYHLTLWHEPYISHTGTQYSCPQMHGE